ncbi:hypothetical protein HaLaN_31345, partial [Haematococcus lacustris]
MGRQQLRAVTSRDKTCSAWLN